MSINVKTFTKFWEPLAPPAVSFSSQFYFDVGTSVSRTLKEMTKSDAFSAHLAFFGGEGGW